MIQRAGRAAQQQQRRDDAGEDFRMSRADQGPGQQD
jgi:hypothetical protein